MWKGIAVLFALPKTHWSTAQWGRVQPVGSSFGACGCEFGQQDIEYAADRSSRMSSEDWAVALASLKASVIDKSFVQVLVQSL